MEKSPPAASASAGAATPDEKAQEEQPRQRSRVPQWTGFGKKTLWDWLQLLIVPAILIGVTFAWSATQTRSDNKREDKRIDADRDAAEEARQAATLQAYLDQMSRLMLDKKLLTSKPSDAARPVARSLTLTTLRRLDGERKAAVLRFLDEARLIDRKTAVVSLDDADFTGAKLTQDALEGANLRGAYFNSANLRGANLTGANLNSGNLRGANLTGAFLNAANLTGAFLKGANLTRANLRGAQGLDLDQFLENLSPEKRKIFLDSQKRFLDSLSAEELAKFNLSPAKLARIRREASGG